MFDPNASPGWFDFVALALTLLGLWFAWASAKSAKKEAKLAKTAAESATAAVLSTERKLAQNQLITTLGLMEKVIADVSYASQFGSVDVAAFALSRYGKLSREAAVLLDARGDDGHAELAARLRLVGDSALSTKAILAKSPNPKVQKLAAEVLTSMEQLDLEVTEALVLIRMNAGSAENV